VYPAAPVLPRLDAVDPRHVADEIVAVDDVVLRAGQKRCVGLCHDPLEQRRLGQRVGRQPVQIKCARVVARAVEPNWRRVVRVFQREASRLAIHHRDEPRDRSMTNIERQILGGVVSARQQERQQQVMNGHALAGNQADLRVLGGWTPVGLGEHAAETPNVLECDE
jgi:hypothetical protein